MNAENGYRKALRRYRLGLLLAAALTAVPAALVLWAGLAPRALLASVLLLALLQVTVHLYCFLNLGRKSRDQTILLTITALIITLMVGGTLVVFFDQMQRM
jgi:cytochrome o ubiquinol oxidase operon protein cyoD